MWEATPDPRLGWAVRAAQTGHSVHVVDAIDSERSQGAPDAYREVEGHGQVQHRTAREVWERLRVGDNFETRTLYKEGQVSVQYFDRLLATQSARRYMTDDQESTSVADVIRKIGDC